MARMLVIAVVLLLAAPAAAHAGTYEVWSCAGPDGAPAAASGWLSEGSGYFSSPSNDCPSGEGLHAGLNGGFNHAANTEDVI